MFEITIKAQDIMNRESFTQDARSVYSTYKLDACKLRLLLVLCSASSFEYLFKSTAMQGVINRLITLAELMNGKPELDVVAYASKHKYLIPVNDENAQTYLSAITKKAKKNVFQSLAANVFGDELIEGLGDDVKALPVLQDISAKLKKEFAETNTPTFVFFINDGQISEEEGLFDEIVEKLWTVPAYFCFAHFETLSQNPTADVFFGTAYDFVKKHHPNMIRNEHQFFCSDLIGFPTGVARIDHFYDDSKVDNKAFFEALLAPATNWILSMNAAS